MIEIVKDGGEDDCAICVPSGPGVRGCKTVKDLLRIELEGFEWKRRITIDDEIVGFGFRSG